MLPLLTNTEKESANWSSLRNAGLAFYTGKMTLQAYFA
jgi:hypothetical protein